MRKMTKVALATLAFATTALASTAASAQQKQLTLCWAAWDPANALVELSRDFTRGQMYLGFSLSDLFFDGSKVHSSGFEPRLSTN